MTDDIAALIERIKGPLPQRVVSVDTGEKADAYRLELSAAERELLGDALSRLAAPALPEEIAGLIKRLNSGGRTMREAASALQAQAQENERLNTLLRASEELKRGYIEHCQDERNAIRAETIDECCDQLTDLMNESSADYWYAALDAAEERIRALAQPGETSGPSADSSKP